VLRIGIKMGVNLARKILHLVDFQSARRAKHCRHVMRNFKTLVAVTLALATTSPAFAITGGGGGPSEDTTYYLDGSSGGYSGWIELDRSLGQFTGYPATPSPIVAFDLTAPSGGSLASSLATPNALSIGEVNFSSADPDISIAASPTPTLRWNPNEITYINLVINDSDPQSLDVHFNIDGGLDIGLYNGLNLGGPLIGSDRSGYFGAPDGGTTWVMLSGAGVVLAGMQTAVRRRAKHS